MITPILLCGGSGTRLWPLSRKSYPKQFADLVGDESLFQASARRFTGEGFGDPLVVTGNDFRFIVTEQLGEVGITPAGIMIEPEGRNTAPAAVAAALFAQGRDPDAMVLLVPSDHAVARSRGVPRRGDARPRAAAEEGRHRHLRHRARRVRRPAMAGWRPGERPDARRACADPLHREAGRGAGRADPCRRAYLWNAGVFLARADTLIGRLSRTCPGPARGGRERAGGGHGRSRLHPDRRGSLGEGAGGIRSTTRSWKRRRMSASCASSGHWSDLGSWESVWQEIGP